MDPIYKVLILWGAAFALMCIVGIVWWVIERLTEDPLAVVNRKSKKDKHDNNLPPYMRGPF